MPHIHKPQDKNRHYAPDTPEGRWVAEQWQAYQDLLKQRQKKYPRPKNAPIFHPDINYYLDTDESNEYSWLAGQMQYQEMCKARERRDAKRKARMKS